MQVKIPWTALSIWFVVGCIAALSCLLVRPAAHIGSDYFPLGNDSFYHATRILEAVRDPAAFYEFDPKIHAPEGSLLVWPWGYDYLMAKIVRAGLAVGLSSDPLRILSWIPVAAVFFSVALLIVIARQLSLGPWPVALAALCFALSRNTQILHGFGQIDHHFAEFIFILGSLAAGLAWFRTPRVSSGIALGAAFGFALAVHNGLFILQVPFLAAAIAHWLQGKSPPARPVVALVTTLLCSSIAVLIPSLAFREGRFEFYTLCWFHLYIVCCTALVVVLLARLQATRRSILMLVAIGVLLVLPLLEQIIYAESFVSGSLGTLNVIQEMRSPVQLALNGQGETLTALYSLLLWLVPVTFALCVVRIWRERQSPRLLFWVTCVLGLALMSTQLRMHYFGSFALFLPWLIVAREYGEKRPELDKRIWLVSSLLLVLAYVPVLRHALIAPVPTGGEAGFRRLHPVFPALRKACAEDPGVVLADTNAGHYIRYFSDCSVIANNFLLTPQQFRKVDQAGRLLSLSPSELLKQAPYVKYVLVRPSKIEREKSGEFSYGFFGSYEPRLARALLLGPQSRLPPEFRLLFEFNLESPDPKGPAVPFARLYKIDGGKASVAPSSVNDVNR